MEAGKRTWDGRLRKTVPWVDGRPGLEQGQEGKIATTFDDMMAIPRPEEWLSLDQMMAAMVYPSKQDEVYMGISPFE